ncbi:MAG: hypothetical protein HKN68_03120 [Saprospiraceae bacterium]|nr:hypothetical protein [Saprospiraceae bacterium]
MKKFHWGHGILVFFIIYVLTLMFVLYKSTTVDHSLVVEDYYNQDLNYQKKYDKVENVNIHQKTVAVEWSENEKSLSLTFEEGKSRNGKVKLYNPADTKKDLSLLLEESSTMKYDFPDLKLSAGRWKVQIDWVEEGIPFYIEKEIYITQS